MSLPVPIFVSVIICSRNRAHEIINCLPGLAEQARNFPDVELIVVDNGSTDNTREVVNQSAGNLQYPFIYVYEPVPGLCQARNRGRKEARGSVLAYMDDDAIVKEGWLERLRQHFLENKSDCLGGKVSIELGGELPFKFEKNMHWFFMASNLGEEPRVLPNPAHPIGCNMAFTTKVFDAVNGFNTDLKLYGDETDFFRRVHEKGFRVYYDPRVEVSQFIPKERLTKEELMEKSYKWGSGAATLWLLANKGIFKRISRMTVFSLRVINMKIKNLIRADFGIFFTLWYNRGYLSRLFKDLKK